MRSVQSRTFLVTCCYCSTRRFRETMTMVPSPGTAKRLEWIRILGDEFGENIKLYADPFVCMSHFKYLKSGKRKRTALPIPLPFCSEKDGVPVEFDEDQERFQLEAKLKREALMRKKLEEKPVVQTVFECAKCGEQVHKTRSIQIPKGIINLSKWVKKLGREFLVNSRQFGLERVCADHLEEIPEEPQIIPKTPYLKRRINEVPPKKHEEKEESLEKMCCYCGLPQQQSLIIKVPEDCEKWQNILGNMFKNYVRQRNDGYICMSHFGMIQRDGKWAGKLVPTPFPFSNAEAGMSLREENECLDEDYLVPNSTPENEVLGMQDLDLYDSEMILREAVPKLNFIVKKIEYEEELSFTKRPRLNDMEIVCCYCKEVRTNDKMVRVPSCPKEFDEWKLELGEDFDLKREDCHDKESICLSHFKRSKINGKRIQFTLPIPLPFDSMKYDYSDEAVSLKTTTIPTRRCVYCGDWKLVTHLITVPCTGQQRKAWIEKLGPQFWQSCRSQSSKICLDHFELLPNGIREKNSLPIPLPFRSDVQVNTLV